MKLGGLIKTQGWGVGGFEFLDHTADMGIAATGADLPEAFANAAQGMFAWIADLEAVAEREERRVEVQGRDLDSLLVEFLNELNFTFETQRFLFRRLQVLSLAPDPPSVNGPATGYRLVARGYGEPLDPERHQVRSQVKAATYHSLKIEQGPGECRVQVILDI